MANPSSPEPAKSNPNRGFDPNHGRSAVDRTMQAVSGRIRQVSTSRPFVAFVALSVVVLGIYFFVIAAPIYVSSTSFSLRGREQTPVAAGALLAAVGQPTNTAAETSEVSQYILSYEMLDKLDRKFNLRAKYSAPRADLLHWLRPGASKETFLAFYKRMVRVQIDRETSIVRVEVRSFDRESGAQIADSILDATAEYVDGLSATIRKDTVKASQQELQKAENDVRDARIAMTRYRTASGMVDPTISAAAATGNLTALQQQSLEARSQLASLLTYNTANSPQVVQLRARIAALDAQATDAQRRIANAGREDTLTQRLYEYEGLVVKSEYAEKALVAALSSYDQARATASQRERFLVRIIPPHVPDRPTLPNRMLSFIEALLVAAAAYGIIALIVAGVRDHQGI